MFTGYYRPPLNRATNVYTQGNTVSGGTYFDKVDMQYPQPGFENEQPEVHDEDKNLDENPETNQKVLINLFQININNFEFVQINLLCKRQHAIKCNYCLKSNN